MRFKKLLVATDFSQPSRMAFATGVAMAADTGAELVLVHVVTVYPYVAGVPAVPVAVDPTLINDTKDELDALVREAKQAGAHLVTAQTLTGAPWHQIVQLVENDPTYDLIILGTHGRTGIKHVLLGSVAEKIVRHSPCAVLVVRDRK